MNLLPKILLVEDSTWELELMQFYLESNGYEVLTASDAKEAVELALTQKPNAIITDIVMPGMSGFELCRLLKRNPVTKKLVVIMCSSKNLEIDRLWGMRQGADAYITKPYTCDKLLSTVKNLIPGGQEYSTQS